MSTGLARPSLVSRSWARFFGILGMYYINEVYSVPIKSRNPGRCMLQRGILPVSRAPYPYPKPETQNPEPGSNMDSDVNQNR